MRLIAKRKSRSSCAGVENGFLTIARPPDLLRHRASGMAGEDKRRRRLRALAVACVFTLTDDLRRRLEVAQTHAVLLIARQPMLQPAQKCLMLLKF